MTRGGEPPEKGGGIATPHVGKIENTLDRTIGVLSSNQTSAENRALLIEAKRLRSIVGNWRSIRPEPGIHEDMLLRVLHLAAAAGTIRDLEAGALDLPPPPRSGGLGAAIHDFEPDLYAANEVTEMKPLAMLAAAMAPVPNGATPARGSAPPEPTEAASQPSPITPQRPAGADDTTSRARFLGAPDHPQTPQPTTPTTISRHEAASSPDQHPPSPRPEHDSYAPVDFAVPKTMVDVCAVPAPSTTNPLLVVLTDPYTEAADAYRSLRRKLVAGGNPRVIAVTSAGPKEGKTTLVLNLALTVRASTRGRTLVVEANLRSPSIARILGFDPPSCFMAQILAHAEDPTLPWVVAEPTQRLHVLAVDPRIPHDPMLDPVSFSNAMDQLKNAGYDMILLDTPPVLGGGDVNVIADTVDGVLLSAIPLVSRRSRMRKAAVQLEPAVILGAVLLGQ